MTDVRYRFRVRGPSRVRRSRLELITNVAVSRFFVFEFPLQNIILFDDRCSLSSVDFCLFQQSWPCAGRRFDDADRSVGET